MKIFFIVLLSMVAVSFVNYASAQSIPLPPPFPENKPEDIKIAENDRNPPEIEILTSELHEGKNVFRVRVTDDSSLVVREVRYVQNGQLKSEGLYRDQNDVYKSLIDIQQPARIVVVSAGDANGNLATAYREYDIAKPDNFFQQIIDMFKRIPDYFQDLIGAIL